MRVISTRDILLSRGAAPSRDSLQKKGELLDRTEGPDWLISELRPLSNSSDEYLVVDAVRTIDQVQGLRQSGPTLHIHLTASRRVLRERYEQRMATGDLEEFESFDLLAANPTEQRSDALRWAADLCVDTGKSDKRDTVRATLSALASATAE